MPKGDKRTKKQHYIPQVYLRGFSPDYLREDVEKDKYRIYFYELDKEGLPSRHVPIKSICYKNDLYEVTGGNGDIVLPNNLEKLFSVLENWFSKYRSRLERKAFLPENYKTNCFLAPEEKAFWVTYIVVQMLRTPEVLELAEKTAKEIWKDKVDSNQAKNIARTFCLPFFKELNEDDMETRVMNAFLEPMLNMAFGIGVDIEGRVITSDKTMFIYTKEGFPCKEYGKIIFPITSKLCFYMYGAEEKANVRKNCLFPINEYDREEIIKSIAASAFKKVYSSKELNDNEKGYINEILSDRRKREYAIF